MEFLGELRGAPAAAALVERQKATIEELGKRGAVPCLGVLRFGEDPADGAYIKGIEKRFAQAGARVEIRQIDKGCTQAGAEAALLQMNENPAIHGILVLRPAPKGIDEKRLQAIISAKKDVDGMGYEAAGRLLLGEDCFAPCTAVAVMKVLEHYGIDLKGKRVAVIGRSNVVGKPLSLLLLRADATPTVCHTRTKNMAEICKNADVVISCAGKINAVTEDMISPAAVLADVGMNTDESGKLCGDISKTANRKAAAFTPVPGGVGVVTTAVLLSHTVAAAENEL